jgi:hypothetical protein
MAERYPIHDQSARKRRNSDSYQPSSKRRHDGEISTQDEPAESSEAREPSSESSEPSEPDSQNATSYTIQEVSRRRSVKYSMLETTYEVKFKDHVHGSNVQDMRQELHTMFDDLLDRTHKYSDDDKARIIIDHDQLDTPIFIHCQDRHNITADTILER